MNVEFVKILNPRRDRGSLLRTRCGRDHVVGHRIVRRCRCLDSLRQSDSRRCECTLPAECKPWSGTMKCFSPAPRPCSVRASFSFKISGLHDSIRPTRARSSARPEVRRYSRHHRSGQRFPSRRSGSGLRRVAAAGFPAFLSAVDFRARNCTLRDRCSVEWTSCTRCSRGPR